MMSMLIAGYARSRIDGNIQLIYSATALLLLVYCFIRAGYKGRKYQDTRAYLFYKKYCDPNGELKDEYLEMVHGDENAKKVEK